MPVTVSPRNLLELGGLAHRDGQEHGEAKADFSGDLGVIPIEELDCRESMRAQVFAARVRAMTVFAADKLSDIAGLRRGIAASRRRPKREWASASRA